MQIPVQLFLPVNDEPPNDITNILLLQAEQCCMSCPVVHASKRYPRYKLPSPLIYGQEQ